MEDSIRNPTISVSRPIHKPNRALTISRSCLCLAALVWLSACQRPAAPEGITSAALADETELDSLWDTTLAVLRKHDFEPDRQDRANGIIETKPTTSKQWHEPWRQDVADRYSLIQASLHTTQRRVTVRFVRDAGWSIEVQVDVYRLTTPETQITSASSVLHAFTGALPTTEGRTYKSGQSPERWVHLGRDGAMEDRLLNRILASADVMSE
ncbi:MAG: hypothetical protein ACE5EQ_07550 [Phycisphaerae bacterium]